MPSSKIDTRSLTNEPLTTGLYDASKAKNTTQQAQNIVTVMSNTRNQINETKKTIHQTQAKDKRYIKRSPVRYLEIPLDQDRENVEKTPKKRDNKLNEIPLSVLLKIVRTRNQAKKVKETAMIVFGTKLGTPGKISKFPISSACKNVERGDWGEPNKYRQPLNTEKKKQNCKPEPGCGPSSKCVSAKDIFNKPRENLSGRRLPTISDGLISTNEYESVSLSAQTLGNQGTIQGTGAFAKDFEPWYPLAVKPLAEPRRRKPLEDPI